MLLVGVVLKDLLGGTTGCIKLWFSARRQYRDYTFCHISHVNGPIQTKFLVDIHIDLGYHPAVSKVDYD